MELFLTLVNCLQPLTAVTNSSTFDIDVPKTASAFPKTNFRNFYKATLIF